MIAQYLKPYNNHILLRKDMLYLHPDLIPNFKKGQFFPTAFHYHFWILNYVYVKWSTVHHIYQASCSDQMKLEITKKKCILSIKTPMIKVPLRIFTSVTSLPTVTEQETWHPFLYKYLGPHISWTTSSVYYINCSWTYKELEYMFKLTTDEVYLVCSKKLHYLLKPMLCFVPNGIQMINYDNSLNIGNSKAFLLSLYIKNISYSSMYWATISVSNIRRKLCGNGKMACSNRTMYSKMAFNTVSCTKLLCSELIIDFSINKDSFDINDTHSILVYIDQFKYTKINLHEMSVKVLKNTNFELIHTWKKIEINYDWKKLIKNYKIFFKEKYFSWVEGQQKCLKNNMTLPSFHNYKHLIRVITFVRDHYRFQPVALFVGKVHGVGVYILYVFLNMLK